MVTCRGIADQGLSCVWGLWYKGILSPWLLVSGCALCTMSNSGQGGLHHLEVGITHLVHGNSQMSCKAQRTPGNTELSCAEATCTAADQGLEAVMNRAPGSVKGC